MLTQECLCDQDVVQQSLQKLQTLGEQLRSQVDSSSAASLQSDHLSLTHRLAALEHSLHRQQDVLQVGLRKLERKRHISKNGMQLVGHCFFIYLVSTCLLLVWIRDVWGFQRAAR